MLYRAEIRRRQGPSTAWAGWAESALTSPLLVPDAAAVKRSTLKLLFLSSAAGWLPACADEPVRRLVDVDGPRGLAVRPGPWPVHAVTHGASATLSHATGDAGLVSTTLIKTDGGTVEAPLPDVPHGAAVRYYVEAGGERLPATGEYHFVAQDPSDGGLVDPSPQCVVRFAYPEADAVFSIADDSRPEAGLQIIPQVITNLVDGSAGRLLVGEVGYASVAAGGLFAFGPVTLPPGQTVLALDARAANGGSCRTEISVAAPR